MSRIGRFPESRIDRILSQHLSNTQYNRLIWTLYPLLRGPLGRPARRATAVGSEWGGTGEVERIVGEFILPFVDASSIVGELGVGGGRVATLVAPNVGTFVGFDISSPMLRQARRALSEYSNVKLVKLREARFPSELHGTFDFVYAFDVFVHLDMHVMWRYPEGFSSILKRGGKAFVHTSNIAAPDGWNQFVSQSGYSVSGHYFVSPETVEVLASHAGFEVVHASTPDPSSSYLNRDHLAVLSKRTGTLIEEEALEAS